MERIDRMYSDTPETGYIKKAKHCIGMDRKNPYIRHGRKYYRPYRNYYATGGKDEDWEVMVAAGYAKQGENNQHGGYTFCLTRSGLDWLGDELGMTIYNEEN